jgi:hypothetical protein
MTIYAQRIEKGESKLYVTYSGVVDVRSPDSTAEWIVPPGTFIIQRVEMYDFASDQLNIECIVGDGETIQVDIPVSAVRIAAEPPDLAESPQSNEDTEQSVTALEEDDVDQPQSDTSSSPTPTLVEEPTPAGAIPKSSAVSVP